MFSDFCIWRKLWSESVGEIGYDSKLMTNENKKMKRTFCFGTDIQIVKNMNHTEIR